MPRESSTDRTRGRAQGELGAEVLRAVNRRLGAVSISARRAAEGLRGDVDELLTEYEAGDPARRERIEELVDTVIDRTDEVRAGCDQLRAMVKGALEVPTADPGEPPAQPPPAEPPVEPPAPAEPAEQREPQPPAIESEEDGKGGSVPADEELPTPPPRDSGPVQEPSSDALRVLVTQMAIAGAGRADIERRLADEFRVGEPGRVVAEVLGPQARRG